MRVLYLAPGVFDKGGISRYDRFQIRALRERYGQSRVRVISKLAPDGEEFEEEIQVSWSGRPNPVLATKIGFAAQALRYAVTDQPDVVVTGHVNLGPLGRLVAELAGAALVQNVYGTELWTDFSGIRKRALAAADGVISDCHNTAVFAQREGLRASVPEVVWDCVDTDRYTPGPASEPALERYGIGSRGHFRLMFLGRLMPDARYKGTERLLRLLAKLPADCECVLAGGGDDLAHLHGLAEMLDLGDRVHLPGRIHEDDMPDVYRSADVFYLVSELGYDKGEGLPLTPIEAMACGVPVIVGDQDGSKEILDDSGGGICVSPDSDGSAVEYVQRLKASPEYLSDERRAARRRAEAAFSYEQFSHDTIRALEDILRRDPAAPPPQE